MDKNTQALWQSREDLKIRIWVDQKHSKRRDLLKAFSQQNIGKTPNESSLAEKIHAMTEKEILRLYQEMATSLKELKDSPWRSAVGRAFSSLGLKGEFIENYIERIGNLKGLLGIELPEVE